MCRQWGRAGFQYHLLVQWAVLIIIVIVFDKCIRSLTPFNENDDDTDNDNDDDQEYNDSNNDSDNQPEVSPSPSPSPSPSRRSGGSDGNWGNISGCMCGEEEII